MPFKNESQFLRETLDSILAQSLECWECICIDDHSTDNSLEIVEEYCSKDSRFKSQSNTGSGVISALQCGYELSSGRLISRMDADDVMPPRKLEVLSEQLINNGEGYISTGKVKYINTLGEGFINYQNWLNKMVDDDSHWENIYKECVIASPNWMMFKTDFDRISGFDSEVYPEDYDLIFRAYMSGLKVTASSEITHIWRDHEQRASRVSELYKENTFLKLKLGYFLKEYNEQDIPLVLWGAGKKGKAIATLLIQNHISFKWLTNNSNKIGRDIYGVFLEDEEKFDMKALWILAVSQPEELLKKENELNGKGMLLGANYHVFV